MFKPHSYLNLRRKIFLGSTSSFPQKPRTCLSFFCLSWMTWIISEQVLSFEGIATFFWKGQWFLFQSFQARILHRHFWRFWEILCPNFYRLIRKTSMLDRCVLVFSCFCFPVLCEKTAHLFSRLTPKRRAQVSLSSQLTHFVTLLWLTASAC